MTTKTKAGLDFIKVNAPELYQRFLDLEATIITASEVTSLEVTTALGYTPVDPADIGTAAAEDVSAFEPALGYTAADVADLGTAAAEDTTAFMAAADDPGIRATTVTLTAAQLADLHNTPVELVPAPGTGFFLAPISFVGVFRQNGGIFAASAQPNVRVVGASVWFGINGIQFVGVVDGSVISDSASALPMDVDCENAALVIDDHGDGPILIPGAILTSAIAAAGTGYVALETVTIGDATVRIDTVGGSGEVLTYTVTVPGTNNIIGAAQATTGGSGADFTLDINTLDYSVNPMTLKIKTLYTVMEV